MIGGVGGGIGGGAGEGTVEAWMGREPEATDGPEGAYDVGGGADGVV